jgi:short-subunit dehydrogenase
MRGAFVDLSPEVISTTVGVNILGAAYPTRYALPHLAQSGGGLLFVSSLVGVRGFPGVSVYAASKMALTGLCQSIRSEAAPKGVHVGIVYVGFTENDPDKKILAADGSPMVLKRPYHMGQRQVAQAIVKALRRRRRRTVLTPVGHMLVVLERFVPWLVELVINRSGGKIHQMSR